VEMKTRAHTHRRTETHRGNCTGMIGDLTLILMMHLTILQSFSVYLKMTLICILFYIF